MHLLLVCSEKYCVEEQKGDNGVELVVLQISEG